MLDIEEAFEVEKLRRLRSLKDLEDIIPEGILSILTENDKAMSISHHNHVLGMSYLSHNIIFTY